MHVPCNPKPIGWALSGSSTCAHALITCRLTEFSPTSFCSATANICCCANAASCSSVGPSHNPTKVLIPIALYLKALAGDCNQTPIGKKSAWEGNPLTCKSLADTE